VIENFELMLKELKLLPQKQRMLTELQHWERGDKSLHEIMLYIEKAITDETLDAEWLVEAATPPGEDGIDDAADPNSGDHV